MENATIAAALEEIAAYLEISGGNPFKIRSYHNAAQTILEQPEPLQDRLAAGEDLTELPDIGSSIAGKIRELVETGHCRKLDDLRQQYPPGLLQLLQVPYLGASKTRLVYEQLGVQSVDELRQACEQHRVQTLHGMGAKTEAKLLRSLQLMAGVAGRMLLYQALGHVQVLEHWLEQCPWIERWEVAGSLRRGCATVGDLDVLLVASDRDRCAEALASMPKLDEVLMRGAERVSIRLVEGLQVDFRFVEPANFGAALLYFTGSKAHCIALRQRALQAGLKLNEYGLFRGDQLIAGATETEVYRSLELAWIPPELRENSGEITAAAASTGLPTLVTRTDIRGDLHCHSNASDGIHSIAEMVTAARQRGYQYLAITDHSKAVSIANGLDENRMRQHMAAIRTHAATLNDFWLLAGVEVDILKDGSLDLPDELLRELDWVVASVHSALNQDQTQMTARLLRAIESGLIHCLGHPLGRLIGSRAPVHADWDKIFAACAAHGVCLEINASPHRLDLPDSYCRHARKLGARLVLNTDAHQASELDLMNQAVIVARRGWLSAVDILNTLPAAQLAAQLQQPPHAA